MESHRWLGDALYLDSKEAMIWPLPIVDGVRPGISNGFRFTPGTEPFNGRNHPGSDLDYEGPRARSYPFPISDGHFYVPPGTPAIAALAGRVSNVYTDAHGHVVEIDHPAPLGGIRTVYRHLVDTFVKKGEQVAEGHPLGTVGHDPSTKNVNHLHFEVWELSCFGCPVPKDPANYLSGAGFGTVGTILLALAIGTLLWLIGR